MPRLACLLLLAPPALAQIHVDDDATGANDGSSWHDAFVDLQTALAVAGSGDAIWVATGTYRPSQTLDRTTSFVIPLGVDVYGGFDGTETALDRRAGLYEHTVLTGDLAGDDAPGFVGRDENSLHVVIGSYGMLLDGFTIRGGNANAGNDWEQRGGGMRAEFPYEGEVRNCTFVENEATVGGGGVYVWLALDTYIDCTFVRNRTAGTGGGIWSDNSQTAYAWLEGCRFHGNIASGDGGGGLRLYHGWVFNCVFTGNSADGCELGGGAVLADSGTFVNCSIYGNTAGDARVGTGGILCYSWWTTVQNSVLWGNVDDGGSTRAAQVDDVGSHSPQRVRNSLVEAWDAVTPDWNLSTDPFFVDPDGSDGVLGTADDDLRLRAGSPCIDAADAQAYADQHGPPIDAAGSARRVDALACDRTGDVLDIGALERQVVDGTTSHCPAKDSSLGVPALLAAPCAPSVAANDLVVTASPVPPGSGILLFGLGVDRAIWGDGVLCVGGALVTTAPVRTAGGSLRFALDLTQPPADAITAGTSWGFQALFRDPAAGGAGFQLSDAVRCTFRP